MANNDLSWEFYERFDKKQNTQYNDIINAALIEFYDNGCSKKASFDRIAKKCQLSRASLYYHFGNKDKLVTAVYFTIGDKYHKKVAKKLMSNLGNYNYLVATTLERYIQWEAVRTDEKAARFYREFYGTNFSSFYNDQSISYPFYEMFNDVYDLNMSEDDIKIAATTAEASMAAFMMLYFSGELEMTNKKAVQIFCELPFEHMRINNEPIDKIINESIELFETLNFKILPYFDIE